MQSGMQRIIRIMYVISVVASIIFCMRYAYVPLQIVIKQSIVLAYIICTILFFFIPFILTRPLPSVVLATVAFFGANTLEHVNIFLSLIGIAPLIIFTVLNPYEDNIGF